MGPGTAALIDDSDLLVSGFAPPDHPLSCFQIKLPDEVECICFQDVYVQGLRDFYCSKTRFCSKSVMCSRGGTLFVLFRIDR